MDQMTEYYRNLYLKLLEEKSAKTIEIIKMVGELERDAIRRSEWETFNSLNKLMAAI
jgi:hypothetical protein